MRYILLLMVLILVLAGGCSSEPEEKPKPPASKAKAAVATPAPPAVKPQAVSGKAARFTATGKEMALWKVSRSNAVAAHPKGILITSAEKAPKSAGTTQGAFVRVPDNLEAAVGGGRVRVSVTAKKAEKKGSGAFAVAYSTNEVGNSGWKRFDAPEAFKTFSFGYKVGPKKKGNGDFVGIWADTSGSGNGIVVQSLTVEKIGP